VAEQTAPDAVRPDAGTQFRLEMAVQNAILGYWRHFLGLLLAVLLAFFAYGQYTSWKMAGQQVVSEQIATVEADLHDKIASKIDPVTRRFMERSSWNVELAFMRMDQMRPEQKMSLYQAPGFVRLAVAKDASPEFVGLLGLDPLATTLFVLGDLDDETKGDLAAAADRLVAIGAASTGTASAQAYVDAADLYERLGDVEKRKAALVAAATRGKGVVPHGAKMSVAQIAADSGDLDGAIAILRQAETDDDPFLAQDSYLQLGRLFEFADRPADALTEYTAFLAKWPNVPMAVEVKARQEKLGGAPVPDAPVDGVTPVAPVPPAEGAPAEGAPGNGG
jgi:tetratricopeptide (TPR) repeat protein